ncbi:MULTISPECIES: DUF6302 family protein [Streptomyces]|uniref:DUF6302 family protein n=1 Tax=Streptomyces TaxID=1883 RepID=UPI00204FFAA6|nr:MULTISPECIES: DUF6302 family protein [Streptomyces]UPT43201.1 DUF6302 family protein [Streptomyces sp. WAC00303]WIY77395.1 DUF6302 family protein [Streptomyces anulatus]
MTTTVIALPQDAYDFDYFEQRISDTWLLDKSIAVRTLRMPFLAVPVGGTRRGGYYPVSCLCFGFKVRDLLLEQPGFPDLRVRWSPYRDTCHTVEWGDPAPEWWEDDAVFGRFYGYSESAITSFLRERPQTPSSATSTPCSPTAS